MSVPPGDRRRWALGGAGIIAALLALAAIFGWWPFGGSLSRAELIAEGDAICARAHEAFEELQSEPPRTSREATELTEQLIGIAEDEHDEIDSLDPPAELEQPLDRYLEVRERGIELLRQGLAAAEAAESHPYEVAQAELAATQRAPRRRLARRIGFEECSKPLVEGAELDRQAEPPRSADPDAPPVVSNPD